MLKKLYLSYLNSLDKKTNSLGYFLLTLFTLFLALHYAGKLQILVSMTELVDQSLPSAQKFRQIKDDFRIQNSVFLSVSPKKSLEPEHFSLLKTWERTAEFDITGLENITSVFDLKKAQYQNEYLHYFNYIDPQKETTLSNFYHLGPWNNILGNSKLNEFSFEAHFQPLENKKYGSFNPMAISHFLENAHQNLSRDFNIFSSGNSLFTYYALKGVQQNFITSIVFLIFLIVFSRLYFASFKSGFLLITSFLWVGAISYGIMGILNMPIEILSSGLMLMIALSSIEDFFFLMHEEAKHQSINQAFQQLIVPSFFTSLTTMIGFGSLAFSSIDIIARFGSIIAIAAFLEWFAIFFIIPILIKLFGLKQVSHFQKAKLMNSIVWNQLIQKLTPKKYFSFLILLIYPLAYLALNKLEVSAKPNKLFPNDHVLNQDFSKLKNSRGWEAQASIVFPSNIEKTKQLEILAKLQMLANIQQIENYFHVEDFMTHHIPEDFRVIVVNDFYSTDMRKRYQSDDGKYRHIIFFKDSDFKLMQQTITQIKHFCEADCEVLGEIISYVEFMQKVPHVFIKSLGVSILLVAIILVLLCLYQGLNNIMLFVLASLWGPGFLICMMYITKIPMNFLSCVFMTLMIGLTGDNAIQIIFAGQKKSSPSIHYHQKCSVQLGILLAILCFVFSLSYFTPPREFGPILALGFILSTFGDICLAKSLTQK